jgi:hypothetical protein
MSVYRKVVTGVSTTIFLVKALCRIQSRYGVKILAWAQANMSASNYATFLAWFEGLGAMCLLLESTPDD